MMNLTNESLEDLKGVITALEHLKDSSCIILADCPNKLVQNVVREELEQSLRRNEVRFREIRLSKDGGRNIPNLILGQNPKPGDIFLIYNFRSLLPDNFLNTKDWPEAIQMLNLKREVFVQRKLSAIFWLDDETIKAIARRAPDFWAFRTLVVQFEPEEKGEPIAYEGVTITIPTSQEREDAIALKQSLLRTLSKDPPGYWRKASILYSELGVLYFEKGDLDKALKNFRKHLEIGLKVDEPEEIARAYGEIGVVLADKGDLEGALENHYKAVQINQKTGRPEGLASNYGNIGDVLRYKGDFERALENHAKALEIDQKIGNPSGMAEDYGNIGIILREKGDLEGALENYTKVLEIFEKIGNSDGTAKTYVNIGNVLCQKGDLEGALENQRKALEINEKIGRPEGMANNYGSIGNILMQAGDLEGALENYRRVLEIFQKIGNPVGTARTYGNIGNVIYLKGDLEGALENHKKALEINRKIGLPGAIAINYGNIGTVLMQKGDLQGALKNYNRGMNISERIGQPAPSARMYINIAIIHSLKGDYKSAGLLLLQALLIYSQIGMKTEIEDARRRLAISIGKLKQQRKFEEFLREAKKKFGEEISQQLQPTIG